MRSIFGGQGVAVALVLAGCGLVTSDPSGGVGGSGGGAGIAGSSGSAGQPPGPVICTALERAGPVVELGSYVSSNVAAVGTSLDLVFDTGSELRLAQWVEPWTGAFGPPVETSTTLGDPGTDRLLLTADTQHAAPVGLHRGDFDSFGAPCLQLTRFGPIAQAMVHVGDFSSSSVGLSADALIAGAPGSETYLLAYGTGGASKLGLVGPGGALVESEYIACSTLGQGAAGWYSPSGEWIVALANGVQLGACDVAPGLATRLQTARVAVSGDALTTDLRGELLLPVEANGIAIAQRSDGGAWLTVRLRDAEEETSLHAMRLAPDGSMAGSLVPVADPGAMLASAIAPFGQRAALAWHAEDGSIRITLLDESTTLDTPPIHVEPANATSWISMASSPNADSVVVTWQDPVAKTWAARFDCVP